MLSRAEKAAGPFLKNILFNPICEMENYFKNDSFPPEIIAEYRILKNNLFQSVAAASQRKTILILSSIHGEGSSTVAKNVSRIIAEEPGLKVLLMDVNFCSMPQHVGQKLPPGLSNYLAEENSSPESLLSQGDVPNFYLLPPGNAVCDPARVLKSKKFAALMNEYKKEFSYILIDAPPLQYSPETNLLASQVDGIVLVVQAERTKREIVVNTSKKLNAIRANLLGIVLNRKQYYIPKALYTHL